MRDADIRDAVAHKARTIDVWVISQYQYVVNRRAIPSPPILDAHEKYKVAAGRQVWRNRSGDRLYTWDSLHGEVEVFDSRGFHLGTVDPRSGLMIKEAVRGRRLEGL